MITGGVRVAAGEIVAAARAGASHCWNSSQACSCISKRRSLRRCCPLASGTAGRRRTPAEQFHGLREGHLFNLLDEIKDVPAGLAPEAVPDALLGIDGERRRAFLVKGAKPVSWLPARRSATWGVMISTMSARRRISSRS